MDTLTDLKAILHSKRANIYYLEYCRVLQKDGRVLYLSEKKKEYLYWNIPIANTTCLLLGTGTSITQPARRIVGNREAFDESGVVALNYGVTKESVERIKDIISEDVEGCVYNHHIADTLGVEYSDLRTAIARDNTPVKEISEFCYAKGLVINDLLFDCKN